MTNDTKRACSSCGLTMGQSKLLADIKAGDVRYVRADTVDSGDAVAKVVRGECHEGTYPDAKAMTITDADWENFPDGTLLYLHPPRAEVESGDAVALTDHQRCGIQTAIAAMRRAGWDHYAPDLEALLAAHPPRSNEQTAPNPSDEQDAETWREILSALLREIPHNRCAPGNAPGHGHLKAGIWDNDNGALSGTECAWCKAWNAAHNTIAKGASK